MKRRDFLASLPFIPSALKKIAASPVDGTRARNAWNVKLGGIDLSNGRDYSHDVAMRAAKAAKPYLGQPYKWTGPVGK